MSSLVSFALRVAAIRAIRGATLAGDRVHDSAISPIDHMVEKGESEPFIVIATEDEEAVNLAGRDATSGARTVDLVIEVAIAHSLLAPGDNSETPPEIVIPATDGGFELSLALIGRQIMRALFEPGTNPWACAFARFAVSIGKISNRRGVGNKAGARFAARQYVITLNVLQEPSFGMTPAAGDAWHAFLAVMRNDPELAHIEPVVAAVITGEPEIADWDRARADCALTPEAAWGIGIGGVIDGEAPPLAITADIELRAGND